LKWRANRVTPKTVGRGVTFSVSSDGGNVWRARRGGERAEAQRSLEAGAAIVVGALPEADLGFVATHAAVTSREPKPFTVLPIDEHAIDYIPSAQGCFDETVV